MKWQLLGFIKTMKANILLKCAFLSLILIATHGVKSAPGDRDASFLSIPFDQPPIWLEIASDGKFYVGGSFQSVNNTPRGGVARLNQDGSLDTNFVTQPTMDGIYFYQPATQIGGFTIPEVKSAPSIRQLGVQTNGSVIIIGTFNRIDKVERKEIARLKPNGSLDATFNVGVGPDNDVYAVKVLPDGKVLVGGKFTKWNGVSIGTTLKEAGIVRLNPDGSRDMTYKIPTGFEGPTGFSMFVQAPEGKILALANTAVVQTLSAKSTIVRLNADGSVDSTFASITVPPAQVSYLTSDGSGGGLAVFSNSVKRFRADGTEDSAFATRIGTGYFGAALFQPDGKLLLANLLQGLKRYLSDGSVDTSWNAGNLSGVLRMAIQKDGKVAASLSFVPTSFSPGLVRLDGDPSGPPSIAVQPANQTVTEGGFAEFSVNAVGSGPLRYQWQRDGVNIPGETNRLLTIPQAIAGAKYRVVVANNDGSVQSSEATLVLQPPTPGKPILESRPEAAANGRISVMVPSPGGTLIAAGSFTSIGGIPRNHVARFSSDGTLDRSFDSSSFVNTDIRSVMAAAVQSNGAVILVGNLSGTYGGKTHRILRFTPTGALDATFATAADAILGANDPLSLLALPDDRILMGGLFSTLIDGSPAPGFICLKGDGTRDKTFNAGGAGFSSAADVASMALQSDGGILLCVGGSNLKYNGSAVKGIMRLLPSGVPDTAFNARVPDNLYGDGLAVQPDGKILLAIGAGRMNPSTYIPNANLKRLNADGSLDSSFSITPIGPNDTKVMTAYSMAVQPDSRIIVGGSVSTNAEIRGAVFRLNSNGRFDSTFAIGLTGKKDFVPVMGVGILKEGLMLAGGEFTQFDGQARTNLIRLNTGSFGFTPLAPPTILEQPALIASTEASVATFTVKPGGTPPFRYQWFFNDRLIPNATGQSLTLSNLAIENSGRYRVAIINDAGTNLSLGAAGILIVNRSNPVPGHVDKSWQLKLPSGGILVPQSPAAFYTNDQRILVVTMPPPQGFVPQYRLMRFNVDGSHDADFSAVLTNTSSTAAILVTAMAVQKDGKLLVAGSFNQANGVSRNGLARFNLDGSLDLGFQPPATVPAGLSNLAPLDGGKILADSSQLILRLNGDGSLDGSLATPAGLSMFGKITVQSDGKILTPAFRRNAQQYGEYGLARLLSNGAIDGSFGVNGFAVTSGTQPLAGAQVLPGGKIIAFGYLVAYPNGAAGGERRGIVRLHPDGSFDPTFNPTLGGSDGSVLSVLLQPNGKLVISGQFQVYNSVRRNPVRLNDDGTLDPTFNPEGPNQIQFQVTLSDLALATDGKINHSGGRLFGGGGAAAPVSMGRIERLVYSRTGVTLNITEEANVEYLLEFSPTLKGQSWTLMQRFTGQGASRQLQLGAPQGTSGFYRIRRN